MERCNPFELLRAEYAAPQDAEELRLAAEKKMDSLLGGASVVLVDTCSVLHDAFPQAMEHMRPYLINQKKRCYVPVSCVYELKKLSRDPKKDESFREKAACRLHFLTYMKDEKIVDSLGDDADIGFADPMLFSQITALRHRVDSILFITNDYKLGEDVQRHTEPDSGKICVCQINRYGYFSYVHPFSQNNDNGKNPFRVNI